MSTKIKIEDATEAQLLAYATTALGIEAGPGRKRDALIADIRAAGFMGEEIADMTAGRARSRETKDGGNVRVMRGPDGKPVLDENGREVREFLVEIAAQDTVLGSQPVVVGVNADVRLYPRGEPVWVPESYVHAMRNAIETHPVTDQNGRIVGMRDVPAVPFSFVA